jgi:predicted nuclease of predicted toxin-antitoxin system
VRLLLDEMYPAAIAEALRSRGLDVVAVQEQEGLRELGDEALFSAARLAGQVLVTENVKDFVPIEAHVRAAGQTHPGLIFTSNRSFPRHRERFIGTVVAALETFASQHPDCTGAVHWLRPVADR